MTNACKKCIHCSPRMFPPFSALIHKIKSENRFWQTNVNSFPVYAYSWQYSQNECQGKKTTGKGSHQDTCNRCKDLQSSDGPDCAGSSPVGAVWESDKEYSTVEKQSHEFTQGGQLMSFLVIGILWYVGKHQKLAVSTNTPSPPWSMVGGSIGLWGLLLSSTSWKACKARGETSIKENIAKSWTINWLRLEENYNW